MLHCSWYIVHNRCNCYFSFWTVFCPFTQLTAPKNRNFNKMKKDTWRYHHLTQVYQQSWSYAFPEIWRVRDVIVIFRFRLLITINPPPHPLTTPKIKISIKIKQCLDISPFNTSVPKIMIICFVVPEILPFYPPNSPKNEYFKKNEKTPGVIIMSHKCTKNHDRMLNCFWNMVCDRCNCYFSFWAFFAPSFLSPSPLTAQKVKISKKWNKGD